MDYEKLFNREALALKPSGIRKFFDVVAEMPDALSLGVGEPDFPTPWNVSDAAVRSINGGRTQYTSNAGLFKLRELISEYLSLRFDVQYDPKQEIIVTVGASEAIDLSLRAIINRGDEVLVPEPSFVAYSPIITLAGGIPVPVNCRVENNFKLAAADVSEKISDKTKAIILPYPNNPTGAIMGRDELKEVAEILIKKNILVVSDEIYAELTYGKHHVSIASLPNMRERTIVINGFSKSFSMTGWRLGYLACPKEIAKVILKIHQYAIMCAPSASQYAGIEALKSGIEDDFSAVVAMRKEYDLRRRYVVSRLNKMGLSTFVPEGAFYCFPRVTSVMKNGDEFAAALLAEKHVAVVPGSAFGEIGIPFVRLSYAYSIKQLEAALDKIEDFCISSGR